MYLIGKIEHAVHRQRWLHPPWVEDRIQRAPQPDGLHAGGKCADDVEGIAGNQPGIVARRSGLSQEVAVDGRIRLERFEIVDTDDAEEKVPDTVQTAGVIEGMPGAD